MKGLIGYTGFVGSNLLRQTTFDKLYNSKNIDEIKGENFKFVVCSGAPALKWKANNNPAHDLATIELLIQNLKTIKCETFILISTVDVYKCPIGVHENTEIDGEGLLPYGKHRFMLETFIRDAFPKSTIIRLPGLFGNGLKKNIIYDFLHNNRLDLIHCDNVFQFYNLNRLYQDIQTCLDHNINLINFATEPVSVKEVARYAFDLMFEQKTENDPVFYDMNTIYSWIFKSKTDGYLLSKEDVLDEIKTYVNSRSEG
ncbi:NAD(P)-dependent oxidoreductase [Bacillus sp. T33-2]|uniref:NAD(P)-dependent oxidoreductase n=1 Tax=Bacillus sp. T33-2 TaxID=2054168 RepID=UPI000C77F9EF|nr:NAD(P)-dependent oxidoreductase [Bacillus sp. T33-2]PLR90771.1 pyridine nucleotide transhydrogenase [Bacillus sp. T33-2]